MDNGFLLGLADGFGLGVVGFGKGAVGAGLGAVGCRTRAVGAGLGVSEQEERVLEYVQVQLASK